jgi:hypothetical protein
MDQTVLGMLVEKNHLLESDPREPAKGPVPLELQANTSALSSSEETGVIVQASKGKVSSEQDEMVVCGECGSQVSPFELPEHLDFHYAQQLQKESGKPVVRTVFLPSSAGKRKREGGASKSDRANKKKSTGDISSFFCKK